MPVESTQPVRYLTAAALWLVLSVASYGQTITNDPRQPTNGASKNNAERSALIDQYEPTDPSALTMDLVLRQISQLKELMLTNDANIREAAGKAEQHLKEQLQASQLERDKAIALLQEFADKSPTTAEVYKSVNALKNLSEEKFYSVEKQFIERDKRTEQLSLTTATAIAAALSAQKEAAASQNESNTIATNKMELNFSKLIEQTQSLLQAQKNASDDKIDDLKSRVMVAEGATKGSDQSWGYMFGLAGLGLSLLMLVAFVAVNLGSRKPHVVGGP